MAVQTPELSQGLALLARMGETARPALQTHKFRAQVCQNELAYAATGDPEQGQIQQSSLL